MSLRKKSTATRRQLVGRRIVDVSWNTQRVTDPSLGSDTFDNVVFTLDNGSKVYFSVTDTGVGHGVSAHCISKDSSHGPEKEMDDQS